MFWLRTQKANLNKAIQMGLNIAGLNFYLKISLNNKKFFFTNFFRGKVLIRNLSTFKIIRNFYEV